MAGRWPGSTSIVPSGRGGRTNPPTSTASQTTTVRPDSSCRRGSTSTGSGHEPRVTCRCSHTGKSETFRRSPYPRNSQFRLTRGTLVGGTIRDQDGQGIKGATVEVKLTGEPNSGGSTGPDSWLAEGDDAPTTDADGRWTLDNVPAGNHLDLRLKVGHPDYISDPNWGSYQKEQGVELDALRAGRRRSRCGAASRRRGRSPIPRASRSPGRSSSGVRTLTWSGAARRCGLMPRAFIESHRSRAGR